MVVYLLLLYPFSTFDESGGFIISIFFTLILISGVIANIDRLFIKILAVALILLIFALHNILLKSQVRILDFVDNLVSLIFLGLFEFIVLLHVFREGPITAHRIRGAIVAYMLFGLIWAQLYLLIELYSPNSFNIENLPEVYQTQELTAKLVYFSFVTLTTIGYGDITAINPFARALVMFEGLMGQLFPAIFIAKLVSLQIYQKESRRDK
jgi:hypothetical protein